MYVARGYCYAHISRAISSGVCGLTLSLELGALAIGQPTSATGGMRLLENAANC